jgi:hypothetical protein
MKNPILYLIMLMWLQQLQQCFFEKSDLDPARDWNKYGRCYGTGSGFVPGRFMLSNINMSTVKSETRTPVTDVSYFKPNKDRTDVVTSLEEWAARLLKPYITDILKVAKADSNTKIRFQHAKTPTNYSSLTWTTQLRATTIVTKNPRTTACPPETVTRTAPEHQLCH